ncbi:hypothetical protein ES703_96681 [subsurface metagenome]
MNYELEVVIRMLPEYPAVFGGNGQQFSYLRTGEVQRAIAALQIDRCAPVCLPALTRKVFTEGLEEVRRVILRLAP